MPLQPVSDPAVLAKLGKPVVDPALVAKLDAPQGQPEGGGSAVKDYLTGVAGGETALNMAGGTAGAALGGLAGLGAEGANLFGADIDAAGLVRRVQNALTYEPRTEGGKMLTKAVGYPFEKLGEATEKAGEKTSEVTGSPALGAAVKTAGDVIPMMAAHKVMGKVGEGARAERAAELASEKSRNAVADQSYEEAHRVGYSIPPSEVGGGGVGAAVESVSGRPKAQKMAAERNQEVTDRLARVSLGLPPDTPLSMENIERVRDQAGRIYERLASTGDMNWDQQYIDELASVGDRFAKIDKAFPDEPGRPSPTVDRSAIESLKGKYFQQKFSAREAIDAIRELRKDATNSFAKREPVMGAVQRDIANVLEGRLERHAEKTGNPELAQQFKDARKLIARTISVEDALNTGTGHVSAPRLAQLQDRGTPLDGELALVARSAKAFPRSLQDVKGHEANATPIEYLVAAGGLLHNPALSAAAMARPAGRALAASGRLTRRRSYEPGPDVGAATAAGVTGAQESQDGQ